MRSKAPRARNASAPNGGAIRQPARAEDARPTRDYYLVEDDDGRRFWLYREGLYGRETTAARWFVHGLFA